MAARFSNYLSDRLLPSVASEVRGLSKGGATLAMVAHAPSPGLYYPAVDDFIVSIVRRSQRKRVVRDIGVGRAAFTEAKGCICVTPPRRSSFWQFDGTPGVLHIAIPATNLDEELERVAALDDGALLAATRPSYDPVIEGLADRVWELACSTSPVSGMVCEQAAGTLLGLVLEKFTTIRRSDRTTLPPWRLARALDLLSDNLAQPPSIAELAALVGLSPSHFSRAFSASAGCSPYAWVSRKRVERAKSLLEMTSRSTVDIALELGYCSPNHFAARFRQFTGVSPREWRRRHPAPH